MSTLKKCQFHAKNIIFEFRHWCDAPFLASGTQGLHKYQWHFKHCIETINITIENHYI